MARYVADKFGLAWTVVAAAQRGQPGIDQAINKRAFSLPRPQEGNKSVGFTLLEDGDAAVISVTNVQNKEAENDLQDVAMLARILASQQGTGDFLEWRESLAESATIKRTND